MPYIRGTSETIECVVPPYKICVAHKPITALQRLLTNFKDKGRPEDRQGAVYKINAVTSRPLKLVRPAETLACDWLNTRKQQENDDVNNFIAEHHLQPKHQIDLDSMTCITYSTDYRQQITIDSWSTNLAKTPLTDSQKLPTQCKWLTDGLKKIWHWQNDGINNNLTNNKWLFNCDK